MRTTWRELSPLASPDTCGLAGETLRADAREVALSGWHCRRPTGSSLTGESLGFGHPVLQRG
eukprot:14891572-Alexandrium_andersonii.AAC.1